MKALTFLVTAALVTFATLTSHASVQQDQDVVTLVQLLKQSENFGAQPINFEAVSTDSSKQWADLADISANASTAILSVRIEYTKVYNTPSYNQKYAAYLNDLESAFDQITSRLRAKGIEAIVVKAEPAAKELQKAIDKAYADLRKRNSN